MNIEQDLYAAFRLGTAAAPELSHPLRIDVIPDDAEPTQLFHLEAKLSGDHAKLFLAMKALWAEGSFWKEVRRKNVSRDDLAIFYAKFAIPCKGKPDARNWSGAVLRKRKRAEVFRYLIFGDATEDVSGPAIENAGFSSDTQARITKIFSENYMQFRNANGFAFELAMMNLKQEEYRHLVRIARQLLDDARWCANSYGKFQSSLPMVVAVGNSLSAPRIEKTESLVDQFLVKPPKSANAYRLSNDLDRDSTRGGGAYVDNAFQLFKYRHLRA